LKAAEGMRLMINDGMLRRDPVLFCGILDRFLLDQKQFDLRLAELGRDCCQFRFRKGRGHGCHRPRC